ncbi:MAG: 4Fe-4S dicluster domain-containing protein [Ramlibacter sp.]
MRQLAMMVDLERCLGCRSCEISCQIENGATRRRNKVVCLEPREGSRLTFMSMPCMHCEKPACRQACPTGAISKREKDGVVLINQSKCIGCRFCSWACPYGAMGFDEERMVADKCTYCAHRLDRGEAPACVSKCPGHALSFGKSEDLRIQAKSQGRALMDIDAGTNPSTFYLARPGA